jgi:hypothetical protein
MCRRKDCALFGIVAALVLITSMVSGQEARIEYGLTGLGAGQWQYNYTVSNVSLGQNIGEFTIYFDYGLYGNLSVMTPTPLKNQWSEILLPADGVLHQGPIYDAASASSIYSIAAGQTVGGFAVRFNYTGLGTPGPQYFEIVDPTTFETLASGRTIPEPGMMGLMLLGGAAAARRKNKFGSTPKKLVKATASRQRFIALKPPA